MFCRSIPRTITWWRAPGMSSLGPRGMCHPYQAFLRWARPQNVMPHARSSCCITLARPLVSLRSTISLARHGSAMLSQFQQRTLRTYVPLDSRQEIFEAIQKARVKKPVLASMGSMATSGGYYIASACEKIVANPGTLTGSIGVIMQFNNLEELMKKIGVRGDNVRGRLK